MACSLHMREGGAFSSASLKIGAKLCLISMGYLQKCHNARKVERCAVYRCERNGGVSKGAKGAEGG